MIEFIEQITSFDELYNSSWGQAVKILDEIYEQDKEEELMSYLDMMFSDTTPTRTEINDLLAYDWEEIYQAIGMEEDKDDDN